MYGFDDLKQKSNLSLPCHTVSSKDAEMLFTFMSKNTSSTTRQSDNEFFPDWVGGLSTTYSFGGKHAAHLNIFNEPQSSLIFNVVAAIPGSIESDRYKSLLLFWLFWLTEIYFTTVLITKNGCRLLSLQNYVVDTL